MAASTLAAGALSEREASDPSSPSERDRWLETLTRIARPVLVSLSEGQLKRAMPVETAHGNRNERARYTYLEALGRLLAGLAPWLESGEKTGAEGTLRQHYADLARRALASAVVPSSPDFMNFNEGQQPVVDAAFLALAILRAPHELWHKLDGTVQHQLVEALRSTRIIRPGFNNWLLFSATVEAFLCFAGERWDDMRVDYALRQHNEWYKGDGIYGDGPQFHWDYYNSFVIHPLSLAVLDAVSPHSKAWDSLSSAILDRAKRYAAIQERLIAPDGTYPVIGRSVAYRCGAFHLLADMALRRQLPDHASPEQVRSALGAVIGKTLDAKGTFDNGGWLTIGVCGHQPSLGENYISTGSLYLCSVAFLPLGLPRSDPFWSGPPQPWTSRKVWNGDDVPADHALA